MNVKPPPSAQHCVVQSQDNALILHLDIKFYIQIQICHFPHSHPINRIISPAVKPVSTFNKTSHKSPFLYANIAEI